ncbi:MAG: Uma2 family endonuclease [Anaerolineae bacterium]
MSTQPHERIGMSLEEFLARGETQPFELIEGEVIARMSNVYEHVWLIEKIYLWMLNHVLAHHLGRVHKEVSYTTSDSAQWVSSSRIPDIAFYQAHRIDAYRQARPKGFGPLRLVPDLTVELVSPSEKADDTAKKIAADLANGVREVWVIDMTTQAAHIHTPNGVTEIAPDGALTTPLLPAFELRLPDLFAALDEL